MEGIESMGVGGNVSGEDGDKLKARVMMYKAVVQALIIYGIKIWVFMDLMMKAM